MIHQIIRKAARFLDRRSRKDTKEDFYFNKIYFRRTLHLYNLFQQYKQEGKLSKTAENIQPLGVKFGTDYRSVLKIIEKPTFIYDNKNSEHNHKTLFVRQTISNLKFLVQFQFYNNQLFFISIDFSRHVKNEEEKTEIINTIIEKYLNKPLKEGESFPIIEDSTGNFIIINDDVNFSICYYGYNLADKHQNILALIEKSMTLTNKRESLFYAF